MSSAETPPKESKPDDNSRVLRSVQLFTDGACSGNPGPVAGRLFSAT